MTFRGLNLLAKAEADQRRKLREKANHDKFYSAEKGYSTNITIKPRVIVVPDNFATKKKVKKYIPKSPKPKLTDEEKRLRANKYRREWYRKNKHKANVGYVRKSNNRPRTDLSGKTPEERKEHFDKMNMLYYTPNKAKKYGDLKTYRMLKYHKSKSRVINGEIKEKKYITDSRFRNKIKYRFKKVMCQIRGEDPSLIYKKAYIQYKAYKLMKSKQVSKKKNLIKEIKMLYDNKCLPLKTIQSFTNFKVSGTIKESLKQIVN